MTYISEISSQEKDKGTVYINLNKILIKRNLDNKSNQNNMMDNSKMINFVDKELLHIIITIDTKEAFKTIKNTEKESIFMQMEIYLTEIILMT